MKGNSKILLIVVLALLGAILGGCGKKSGDGEAKNIVLKLADIQPEDYPTVKGDMEFARLVEERTGGRIKVEVYPSAQLGDEKASIEQVQFGAIDLVRTSVSPLSQYEAKLNVLMLPYLYKDVDHMFRVLDGPIGDDMLLSLEDKNMIGLCWLDSGARNFYNTKRPIKSLSDLKGLKIRVQESELMLEMVKALGASPTPMAFGEVYSALQTGVIDGAENNWPSYESTSHFEVAKYYTLDGHTRAPEMILINKGVFNKLSDEDKEVIKQAAKEAAILERKLWIEREDKSKEKILANGNEVNELTPEARKAFQEAVMPLYEKFASDYSDVVKAIIDTK